MYLRTIARRNKDGSVARYYQLAHNARNARGWSQAEVLYTFGREEELDREALARLVRSISRVLTPEQALAAGADFGGSGSAVSLEMDRPVRRKWISGLGVLDHLLTEVAATA
ncbi:MAG: hypothetical protein FJ028_08500 [Chloroflexi bacterium]|nr:hypothetical protein [Chloroflexota bacterium]